MFIKVFLLCTMYDVQGNPMNQFTPVNQGFPVKSTGKWTFTGFLAKLKGIFCLY